MIFQISIIFSWHINTKYFKKIFVKRIYICIRYLYTDNICARVAHAHVWYVYILCFDKIARILFRNKIKNIFLISNNISIKIKLDLIEVLKINFIIIERNLKKSKEI